MKRPLFPLGQAFVAYDPGTHVGIAAFHADHTLAALVACKHEDGIVHLRDTGLPVIVEKPEKYPWDSIPPNALITLAVKAGQAAGAVVPREAQFVTPKKWKGQIPKEVCATRALAVLSADERALVRASLASVKKQDDALDAMALGLWASGRLDLLARD